MHVQYRGATHRGVYDCRPKMGAEVCWNVPARAVDAAVAALFLEAMNPPEIELGLRVVRETERLCEAIDRQWRLRLERARYEAQLAERRYKAVDPDNRVIARTLEREWNDRLAEMEVLEREHQEVRRRERLDLTAADRARILALAHDLPAVWNAATTTYAERKNLVRMVVREVTLTPLDGPPRRTRIEVLWVTGATSDFTVPRMDKYLSQATPPDALAVIRRLFHAKATDVAIATALNRCGLKTGRERVWDFAAVRRVRYDPGWYRASRKARRIPNRRADGLYSVRAVATRMDVPPGVVRYWARTGVLEPVVRGSPGCPHWFRLDAATIARLKKARATCHAMRTSSNGDDANKHKRPERSLGGRSG
jgi:hypothetical protein